MHAPRRRKFSWPPTPLNSLKRLSAWPVADAACVADAIRILARVTPVAAAMAHNRGAQQDFGRTRAVKVTLTTSDRDGGPSSPGQEPPREFILTGWLIACAASGSP
jgi:hypothetical protein